MTLLIEEFDRLNGYVEWGFASTAKWLEARLDIGALAARERVRVARAIRDLPLIRDALSRGAISYRRARTITRVAKPANEEGLLELARHVGGAELDRRCQTMRNRSISENPEEQRKTRSLSGRHRADGMGEILAVLEPVAYAVVEQAIAQAGRDLDVSMETDDDLKGSPIANRRRADALSRICAEWLAGSAQSGGARSIRPTILISADATSGEARIGDGPSLARETMEMLLCDANIKAMIKTRDGYRVSRATARIPERTRRRILERDRSCQYPGCRNDTYLDVHHKKPGSKKRGDHSCENLIALCTFHHRVIHSDGYWFVKDPYGEVAVRTPKGVLYSDPRAEPSSARSAA
jgi:hypothetical protein